MDLVNLTLTYWLTSRFDLRPSCHYGPASPSLDWDGPYCHWTCSWFTDLACVPGLTLDLPHHHVFTWWSGFLTEPGYCIRVFPACLALSVWVWATTPAPHAFISHLATTSLSLTEQSILTDMEPHPKFLCWRLNWFETWLAFATTVFVFKARHRDQPLLYLCGAFLRKIHPNICQTFHHHSSCFSLVFHHFACVFLFFRVDSVSAAASAASVIYCQNLISLYIDFHCAIW